MLRGTALSWRRIAAAAAAAALAIAGLWLAVGAGASGQGGTRAAAYPPPTTFPYKMHIDSHPAKRTHSHKAKFRFHVTFSSNGNRVPNADNFLAYKCKRDHKPYRKCTSPKRYRHLKKGRHVFKVKAVYKGSGQDASAPARFRWRII
jgi:hypothetical protein